MRIIFSLFISLFIVSYVYTIPLDAATFSVGEKFFSQALYTEAEKRFLDIVRKFPDSEFYTKSLFYLGQTYGRLGKYKPALQYYKILLKKGQTISEKQSALLGIAKSWMQIGVYNKAAEFYAFFAAEYPEAEHASSALYFAGLSREREGKIEHAIEKYRAVLELYPQSDDYAKSIEKLAVLENSTPELLWEDNCIAVNPQKVPAKNLFPRDDFEVDVAPGLAKSVSRKGLSSENLSFQAVEIKQSPKTEKSVEISELATTDLELMNPLTREASRFKDSSAVQIINGNLSPANTGDTLRQKHEYDAYRKRWNEEQNLEKKQSSIMEAENTIEEMMILAQNKAQILDVKEEDLRQQYRGIREKFYEDFKDISAEREKEGFVCLPEAVLMPQEGVVKENVKVVLSSKYRSSKKNRASKKDRCNELEMSNVSTYVLDKFDEAEEEDLENRYDIS